MEIKARGQEVQSPNMAKPLKMMKDRQQSIISGKLTLLFKLYFITCFLIYPSLAQTDSSKQNQNDLILKKKLKKLKPFEVLPYTTIGAVKKIKQLPLCILVSEKMAKEGKFGDLALQNYTNYHVVILGKLDSEFIDFHSQQLKVKIDSVPWESQLANYQTLKHVLSDYCAYKQLVFILRGNLKNEHSLSKLNYYFQTRKIWNLYHADLQADFLYINAFYRDIYFRVQSNDFEGETKQILKERGFHATAILMYSLAYRHSNLTRLEELYENDELQQFVLSSSVNFTQGIRNLYKIQQLIFSAQTKVVDQQVYLRKKEIGEEMAKHELQNDITLKQIQRFMDLVELKNLPSNHSLHEVDRMYMEEKYNLNLFKEELPMCVVVLSHNNVEDNRYKKIMQTILYQNYTNYHIVFIDDFSIDGTLEATQQYVWQSGFPLDRITYVRNEKQLFATYNIYNAANNYCKKEEIFVLLDGDDEVVGRHAFRLINSIYLKEKVYKNWIVWTNYYSTRYQIGQSKDILDVFVDNPARYRERQRHFFGMIRTFITQLFLRIKEEDHKDKQGNFFDIVYDEAMQQPLLQMAGWHFEYVPQLCYLYNKEFNNFGTNLEEKRNRIQQIKADVYSRKPYAALDSLFD